MHHICRLPEPRLTNGQLSEPKQTGAVNYHGKSVSDPEVREKLDALANKIGLDIHVTSGDRTQADQERLRRQGYRPARHSQHLLGKAADIWVEKMKPLELANHARDVGFTGIGIYRNHLHVDTRPQPATWYSDDN